MELYNNDNNNVHVVGDYCSGLHIDLNTIHLYLKDENIKILNLVQFLNWKMLNIS